MRSDVAARTLLSVLIWPMLFLSQLAAHAIMISAGDDAAHTAELIRQHREAIAPLWPVPAQAWEEIDSRACDSVSDGPATHEEDTSMHPAEPDVPVGWPAGMRPKRSEV